MKIPSLTITPLVVLDKYLASPTYVILNGVSTLVKSVTSITVLPSRNLPMYSPFGVVIITSPVASCFSTVTVTCVLLSFIVSLLTLISPIAFFQTLKLVVLILEWYLSSPVKLTVTLYLPYFKPGTVRLPLPLTVFMEYTVPLILINTMPLESSGRLLIVTSASSSTRISSTLTVIDGVFLSTVNDFISAFARV